MLLVKLDSCDLQSEKMSPFEGTLVYAQQKRQQVVMTDHWSKQFPSVQFTTMHPGKLLLLFTHNFLLTFIS